MPRRRSAITVNVSQVSIDAVDANSAWVNATAVLLKAKRRQAGLAQTKSADPIIATYLTNERRGCSRDEEQ